MGKGAYIGVGGVAKKVKKMYVGVGGVAKKVKKAYVGVNGVAKLWYLYGPEFIKQSNIEVRMATTTDTYLNKYEQPAWGPNFAAYKYDSETSGTVVFINASLSSTIKAGSSTGMNYLNSFSGGQLGNYALHWGAEEYDNSDDTYTPSTNAFAHNSSYTTTKITSTGLHYNSSFANIGSYALMVGGGRTAGSGSGNPYGNVNWINTSLTKGTLDSISGSDELGARSGRGNSAYGMFFRAGGTTYAYNIELTRTTVGSKDTSLVYDSTAGNDNWVIEHRGYTNAYNKTVAYNTSLTATNMGSSALATRYGGTETAISSSTVSIFPGGAMERTESGTVITEVLTSIRLIDESLTITYAEEDLTAVGSGNYATRSIPSAKIGDTFLFPLDGTRPNINVYKLEV